MNKTKITLAAVGGVIALAALVLGYFVWCAAAEKAAVRDGDEEEGTDGLETVRGQIATLSRKSVYPGAASVRELTEDDERVAAWQADAMRFVSRGDRQFKPTTPATFKEFLVRDAKRLAEGFDFGPFKDYITEGKMPAEADLPKLQRSWDDVATIVEILAANGLDRLASLEIVADKPREEDANAGKAKKRPAAKKRAAAAETGKAKPLSTKYVFAFTIPPAGFVRAINAIETGDRFAVVEDFSIQREKDVLGTVLGGKKEESSSSATTSSRRRRRGGAAAAEAKPAAADRKGLPEGVLTDPVLDGPLTVRLTVTMYDFRSLEEKPAEGEAKK